MTGTAINMTVQQQQIGNVKPKRLKMLKLVGRRMLDMDSSFNKKLLPSLILFRTFEFITPIKLKENLIPKKKIDSCSFRWRNME